MLNLLSPYEIEEIDQGYQFTTESGALYFITFIEYPPINDFLNTKVFMFNIDRSYGSSKHFNTQRVRDTIIHILNIFFANHSDALLTIYDIVDGKQNARRRLFAGWYNRYGKGKVEKRECEFMIDKVKTYATLYYLENHIDKEELNKEFEDLVSLNFYC